MRYTLGDECCFLEKSKDRIGNEMDVEELEQLRDKYEGKLTASLYTGTLLIALLGSLIAVGVICAANYWVNSPRLNCL